MAAYSKNHRTTIGHFLSKGKWDDVKLSQTISQQCEKFIIEQSDDLPVFMSLDDTVNPKKKPSARAKRPMEGGDLVYSHLQGKVVYGHQAFCALMSTGDTSLCYNLLRCEKMVSKIDLAVSTAQSLPIASKASYCLVDCWYTCTKVIDAFATKGYHTIGALKTNRIIYPLGIRISINDFAQTCIRKSDTDLVTVGKERYRIYRYEGQLHGIDNAVVLISYPEKRFGEASALRAFLCTDVSVDTNTIIAYYRNRWKIEVFFKQQKNLFGFAGYQIRSAKAIARFWLILALATFYCVLSRNAPLGLAVRLCRKDALRDFSFACFSAGPDGFLFLDLLATFSHLLI